MEDVLKERSSEVTEESLSKLKYDPTSVWGYVEVYVVDICFLLYICFLP